MHICGMDFSSLASYWQIKALLMLEPSVVTPQNQYFPANSERMSVHCLESGCIGKYTHLGPRDFPRVRILHPSNTSLLSAVYGYNPLIAPQCYIHLSWRFLPLSSPSPLRTSRGCWSNAKAHHPHTSYSSPSTLPVPPLPSKVGFHGKFPPTIPWHQAPPLLPLHGRPPQWSRWTCPLATSSMPAFTFLLIFLRTMAVELRLLSSFTFHPRLANRCNNNIPQFPQLLVPSCCYRKAPQKKRKDKLGFFVSQHYIFELHISATVT